MHKRILAALLCACAMLLTGCSELDQVENLAFAVILGVDLTEQGEIEICIQVPKITSQQGEEGSGGSGSSDHLIYSASGRNFDEALNLLLARRIEGDAMEKLAVKSRAVYGIK